MTQNELNTIVNDIKNKSINFADKYICDVLINNPNPCLLYTSPSPRD